MGQLKTTTGNNWAQNTLVINTKQGPFSIRYWWNGSLAIVASTDGCEDACIDDSTHRSDKSRGKITALQFATSSLIQNFRADRTPNFYDLTEWLKYLSAKIKPIREAFVEVGAGCLSGFATDGLRGALIKGLGMTEEQVNTAVSQDFASKVFSKLDKQGRRDFISLMTEHADKFDELEEKALEAEERKEQALIDLDNQKGLKVEGTLLKEIRSENPALLTIRAPFRYFREWCYNNGVYNKGCYRVLEKSPYKTIFYFDGDNELCAFPQKREEAKKILKDVLFLASYGQNKKSFLF